MQSTAVPIASSSNSGAPAPIQAANEFEPGASSANQPLFTRPSGFNTAADNSSAADASSYIAQGVPADSGAAAIKPPVSLHAPTGRTSRFAQTLKANIIETFQLDPRLKSDLTEGNPALRPIKLIQDNFAIGYNPAITWTRTGGDGTGNAGSPTHVWTTDYDKRNLTLYLAGPATKHLSGWFQMTPLAYPHHFFQHWELFQGMANYGSDKRFIQIRGGQGFNWQNAGWGGADRTITQTSPGVYSAFNGFDPTSTSKMISLEATGLNWTTGKVFGYWQPQAGTSVDPNILYHRGYGMGFVFEKLLGKTGISGIQSNLTIGNTPAFNGNPNLVTNSVIGTQSSPFIYWTSWINRSFQDRKGYVRVNPSFGLTTFRVRRFLDDNALPESRTTGYGYTFDLVTIPVRSYWTSILRFDDMRMNDLTHKNSQYTFTLGQAVDFHLPNKARLRVTLDYQIVGQHGAAPSHRFILGFWPIW